MYSFIQTFTHSAVPLCLCPQNLKLVKTDKLTVIVIGLGLWAVQLMVKVGMTNYAQQYKDCL